MALGKVLELNFFILKSGSVNLSKLAEMKLTRMTCWPGTVGLLEIGPGHLGEFGMTASKSDCDFSS